MWITKKVKEFLKGIGPERKPIADLSKTSPVDSFVVVVLGHAGSGRSTFIDSATHRRTTIAASKEQSLETRTTLVEVLQYYSDAHQHHFSFIDTPGLDFDMAKTLAIQQQILARSPKKQVDALIYMHRIKDDRLFDPSVKYGNVFTVLAGSNWQSKTLFATSIWGTRGSDEREEARHRLLQSKHWSSATQEGAQVDRFSGTPEDAWRIVGRLYNRKPLAVVEKPSAVVLLGPCGTGRTTFIALATGRKPPNQDSLENQTHDVQLIQYDKTNLTFVDTPGVDVDVSRIALLSLSSKLADKIVYLIYLHRISDNRALDISKCYGRIFKTLAGNDWERRTILVTTGWDDGDRHEAETQEKQLRSSCWKSAIGSGAKVDRFDMKTKVDAWRNINRVLGMT